jgi:uroporphyrinogen-III decarboxylase
MGRKQKLIKSSATIPLPFEYPVKNFDDWLKIKHWYLFDENRVDIESLRRAKKLQEKGHLLVAGRPGGFDEPRQLMGEENLCLAYYEQPELIRDILGTIAGTSMKTLERVLDIVSVDNLTVHEDMAGKSGPMIGPALINEFIKPYYRRIWDLLSSRGTSLFAQDSDGDMNPVLEVFAEAGVNVFYPCEPAAGMDIVKIRKKYGKSFAMLGGINKHVLRKSREEIKKELEYKTQSLMRGGGMCFSLDHRIPNGTPLENYRYYVKTAQEMLGTDAGEKGWFRFF